MKFLDLFAGIGGFRLGMERAGHKCIGFCEIDRFARTSYKAMFNTEGEIEYHDIKEVTDHDFRQFRGQVEVICGGFPCQAFSLAGRRLGFEDTRGTLFFEIARAAKQIQPRFLFLENVKGLLNHDKGRTFSTILSTLDELGYDVEWQVFNSKNFGVPQNRERVFLIGHLRGTGSRPIFPFGGENTESDSDGVIVESEIKVIGKIEPNFNQSGCVYDHSGIASTIRTMQGGGQEPKIIQKARGYNKGGEHAISPTLSSHSWQENNVLCIREATLKGYAEAGVGDSVNLSHPNSKTRRGRVGKGVANTLLTGEEQGVVTSQYRIRKLTPRECWRLQGFPDWAFDKAQAVNSNSQLYKQAGNSVTVNVIEAIARRIR